MKQFNITGTCRPKEHYMVDITERIKIIRQMIDEGKYFCINRGRQYGKTTTISAIKTQLCDEYCIFSLSFEAVSDSLFENVNTALATFLRLIKFRSKRTLTDDNLISYLNEVVPNDLRSIDEFEFANIVAELCSISTKPIVVLIDEVDQAGNYDGFIKFLGVLRNLFLSREDSPTFQSVILAGVYDIKNLKLKMRSENEHQYNSPWNIAAPFDVDMSLSADGIAGMLAEYKADHSLTFDEKFVAQMIRDYTAGYPFLVSRICMIIDNEHLTWDKEGVLKAVNTILMERNTLFDSMIKKIEEYPNLKEALKRILMNGTRESYNPDVSSIQIAMMFNYVCVNNGQVEIACRIMETRLYNYFLAEKRASEVYIEGEQDRDDFIHDGIIDMPYLLKRFVSHVNETFSMTNDNKFLERNGREIFLTYLRPIINGIGNYYIEAQTRNNNRMDVVIDYLGKQYVVELKIWRGDSYNERGEEQLCRYLEYFNLETGYLLSFCFNKNKQTGLLPPVQLNGRTLIEAIV